MPIRHTLVKKVAKSCLETKYTSQTGTRLAVKTARTSYEREKNYRIPSQTTI